MMARLGNGMVVVTPCVDQLVALTLSHPTGRGGAHLPDPPVWRLFALPACSPHPAGGSKGTTSWQTAKHALSTSSRSSRTSRTARPVFYASHWKRNGEGGGTRRNSGSKKVTLVSNASIAASRCASLNAARCVSTRWCTGVCPALASHGRRHSPSKTTLAGPLKCTTIGVSPERALTIRPRSTRCGPAWNMFSKRPSRRSRPMRAPSAWLPAPLGWQSGRFPLKLQRCLPS
mmetsp:Transcript_29221/g.85395  ORF Transcript_29221/g.85395 Transcript_29221/m.85395 type:complete len:231 (+) Transcript_29221:196-888(+)